MPRGLRGGAQRARAAAQLIERDGNHCWYCGFSFDVGDRACTIDHVVSRSRDGSNRLTNLRLACFYCNMRRGDSPVMTYERSQVLERRRWHAYRDWMLASGHWLPKHAFHHPQLRWSTEDRWACADCGQTSAEFGRSPATVPCTPWCNEPRERWIVWWHEPKRAPEGWPRRGRENSSAPVDARDTVIRSSLVPLSLTEGAAMPDIR